MEETLTTLFATWPFGIFFLVAGLCIGSFLNVCIYRLPAGKSIVWPPSQCVSCQTPIAWYDNIPVVSYLVLGGRCRQCGATFSARYMIVELVTGLLWFGYWLAYFKLGIRSGADHPGVYLVHITLVSALLASGVIDYDRKEIYTAITHFAVGAGVVGSFIWPTVQQIGMYDQIRWLPDITGLERVDAAVLSLVGASVGVGVISATRFLGALAFRREAMGVGDAYLMAAIGACLGWEATILVFMVAPFIGLPFGFWQLWRQRKQTQTEAGEEAEEPPPPKVGYASFVTTVLGFALFLAAAVEARPAWGLAARGLVFAGLVAFGISFLLLRREEEAEEPSEEESPAGEETPEQAGHEIPYGPFLGMAACVVMLVQNYAVDWFRPGLQALFSEWLGRAV